MAIWLRPGAGEGFISHRRGRGRHPLGRAPDGDDDRGAAHAISIVSTSRVATFASPRRARLATEASQAQLLDRSSSSSGAGGIASDPVDRREEQMLQSRPRRACMLPLRRRPCAHQISCLEAEFRDPRSGHGLEQLRQRSSPAPSRPMEDKRRPYIVPASPGQAGRVVRDRAELLPPSTASEVSARRTSLQPPCCRLGRALADRRRRVPRSSRHGRGFRNSGAGRGFRYARLRDSAGLRPRRRDLRSAPGCRDEAGSRAGSGLRRV